MCNSYTMLYAKSYVIDNLKRQVCLSVHVDKMNNYKEIILQ